MLEVIPQAVYDGAVQATAGDESPRPTGDAGTLLNFEEYVQVWDDVSALEQFSSYVPESKTVCTCPRDLSPLALPLLTPSSQITNSQPSPPPLPPRRSTPRPRP